MSRFTVTRPRLLLAAATLAVTGALGGTALAASADAPSALALPVDAPRFAVVDATGHVVRSSAGVTAGLTAANNVEVLFDRDIRGCAYNATIGGKGTDVPAPAFVTVSQRGGKPTGVFVAMRAPDQTKTVAPFHLVVTC
jgi:hypothetical protein